MVCCCPAPGTGHGKLYFDVELPLCRVLADMERSGFLVDGGALARFGADLSDTIDRLEQRIYAAAGRQFSINSQAAGKGLFEDLGLPTGKRPKPAGPPTPTCWRS